MSPPVTRRPSGASRAERERRQWAAVAAARKAQEAASLATEKALRDAREALRDFRDAIEPHLMAATEYSAAYQDALRKAVDREVARLEQRLEGSAVGATRAAVEASAGQDLVGLVGAEGEKVLAALFSTPDLIALARGGLVAEVAKRVQREVALAALGAQSLHDAQLNVMEILAPDGVTVARAEAIIRTEAGRVLNMAETAKAERLRGEGLRLRRVWRHSGNFWDPRTGHVEADGQEEDEDGYFHVAPEEGGDTEPMRYPGDPAASAANVINCGCSLDLVPMSEETWEAFAEEAMREEFGEEEP